MKLACLRVGQLLDRRAQGLYAHERLRLEEHLAGCSGCRAQANLLEELSLLALDIPGTLAERGRERAIVSAIAASTEARVRSSPARGPRPLLLLGAAALSLAAVLSVWLPRLSTKPQPTPAATQLASHSDRVLSGAVELAGSLRGVGQGLTEHAVLRSTGGARLALAHAEVELHPGAEASWDAPTRRLRLARGSVSVEVDPTPHRSFSVQTGHFTVQVLGTRFVVTERGVYVQRGRVAVETPERPGAPIILAAGSEQTQFELAVPVTAQAPAETSATPVVGEPDRHAASKAADSGGRTALDASALLETARAQLAERKLQEARRTLELAAPKLKKATLRAEALSLEAEASLLEGRFEAARDTYLRVAERFPGLAAAETALFAAARVEAEQGEPARARALLTKYLTRYPSGSYRREAERRLRAEPSHSRAEPAP